MFSIIIPVYNDWKIRDCLTSLAANDFNDKEIIAVDNNSTDPEIKKIIEKFPAKYILETNKSSYSARDTGVKNAAGDILIFLDSDCVVDKNYLKNIALAFQKDIDGLMGKIEGVNNNKIAALEQKFYQQITENSLQPGKSLKRVDTRNFAIEKEVFQKIGGFNKNLKYGADMELGARLHEQNFKILYDDKIIVQHVNETDLNKIIEKRIKQNYDNYKIIRYHNQEFIQNYFPKLLEIKKLSKYYLFLKIGLPILISLTKLTKIYGLYKYANIFAIKIGSIKCYLGKYSPIR